MHTVKANGANIPAIGFGTWDLRGRQAANLVAHALRAGYRHVDTAAMYENEEAVGEGIRDSGVPREDVFLTTKVWYTDMAEGDLQRSVEGSIKRLDFDDVDLALVHWPSKTIPLKESIRALNEVRARGLARHIGVSNFPVALIEQVVSLSDAPIVCNQVEYHPMLNQDKVLAACRRHGLALVAYCPLFRGGDLFSAAPVVEAARRHGRTPAQVVLRWHLQQEGVIPIPRTKTPARVEENLALFDFELSPDEMAGIGALGSAGRRLCDVDFGPEWD